MQRIDRKLDVVVVAYGPEDQLDRCLSRAGDRHPILVVDNGNSELCEQVALGHGARYLSPGSNLGFAAAVNLGLINRIHEGGDVLLLNPDALIDSESISELWAELAIDQELACVSPRLIDADNGTDARACWPFPRPGLAWLQALGLDSVVIQSCDFVIGAVLLCSGVALKAVGEFDERFFLYAEETDWQLRANRLGWKVRLCSEVTAEHVGAGTDVDPLRRETRFHAGTEIYIRKWFGASGWLSYRAAMLVGSAMRAVILKGDRRKAAGRRVRLYMSGPLRTAIRDGAYPGGKGAARVESGTES